MGEASKIEWTDATWSPVTGCTKVSAGCRNCYAERMSKRLRAMGVKRYANGFRVTPHPEVLEEPLHWRKPRRVFVCSMGDLFHEYVEEEFILSVFATMAATPRHQYQVLTKRPSRMREALNRWKAEGLTLCEGCGAELPNVWLGVSIEDQETADERIPLLLDTPAAVRFVSCEPMLGPVDFTKAPGFNRIGLDLSCWWVIVGGETGPGARPMDPAWARKIRDQCKAARVPFFLKQMARKAPIPEDLEIRQWPRE